MMRKSLCQNCASKLEFKRESNMVNIIFYALQSCDKITDRQAKLIYDLVENCIYDNGIYNEDIVKEYLELFKSR